MIEFQKATIKDCKMIYKWRNADISRQHSLNSKNITFEEHFNWINGVLEDKNRMLLIAYDSEIPIGVLRYDCKGNIAEISI